VHFSQLQLFSKVCETPPKRIDYKKEPRHAWLVQLANISIVEHNRSHSQLYCTLILQQAASDEIRACILMKVMEYSQEASAERSLRGRSSKKDLLERASCRERI
jgi:hypothetical protein